MNNCHYCKKPIEVGAKVALLQVLAKNKFRNVKAHEECWLKDLNNDSGNYFDNFVSK